MTYTTSRNGHSEQPLNLAHNPETPPPVAANSTIPAPQLGDNDSENLLRLFIQHVQATGECPYPELEDFLNQVIQSRSTLPAFTFPVDYIKRVNADLVACLQSIHQQAEELIELIFEVVYRLEMQSQVERRDLWGINARLNREFPQLGNSLSRLITLTTQVITNSQLDLESDNEDFITHQKAVHDLQYINAYLSHTASDEVMSLPRAGYAFPQLYFDRLLSYLSTLPKYAETSAQVAQRCLEQRSPNLWLDPLEAHPSSSKSIAPVDFEGS
ncbi:hypothetical protein GS597_11315 [Synechococcales cyanobacterium C]|uniref:Uncharacterized protein n=1 Tax=Petrachloros mirabilis ULC683 TaxID=2781853 RepID=A0A8K2A7N2_9CYAN|nr:hypothetical protein [Petrachloros mirabilis]NCJ07086.1 hypothetical protein [Petrachloros mirabilis ULC683]